MSTINASSSERYIAVIGAGYVGQTTAVCLAAMGNRVVCSDVQEEIVVELNAGKTRLHEPMLGELLAEGLSSGRLKFTVSNLSAASRADFIFVCVPTPSGVNGAADLRLVESVIGELLDNDLSSVIVIRSTIPIGTCRRLQDNWGNAELKLVFVPEFLREGTAVNDFFNPYRVVIGSNTNDAFKDVSRLFSSLDAPILEVDYESAELIKYASNTFLAMKVSFINEISRTCECVGGNIEEIARGVGLDERIGDKFLVPGPGWGGSCFPKDVDALLHTTREAGLSLRLIGSIADSNREQFDYVAERISQYCRRSGTLEVAVLGLAFKAGTNDVRESPSLQIIERLLQNGIRVVAYDPVVEEKSLGDLAHRIGFTRSLTDATRNAAVVAILTDWPEIINFQPQMNASCGNQRIVVDTRRVINCSTWENAGFQVIKLGTRDVR